MDVISAMAFYGAWGTSEDWFQVRDDSKFHEISPTEKNRDINEDIAITRTAFIVLAISHGLSFIVFITQFIFLYNHHQCRNMYFVKEWDDLFYALIMLLSLFATAFYLLQGLVGSPGHFLEQNINLLQYAGKKRNFISLLLRNNNFDGHCLLQQFWSPERKQKR